MMRQVGKLKTSNPESITQSAQDNYPEVYRGFKVIYKINIGNKAKIKLPSSINIKEIMSKPEIIRETY